MKITIIYYSEGFNVRIKKKKKSMMKTEVSVQHSRRINIWMINIQEKSYDRRAYNKNKYKAISIEL